MPGGFAKYGSPVLTPNVGTGGPFVPTSTVDTDGTMAANSDARIPSQKATVTYVTTAIANGLAGLDDLALCNFATSAALPTCTYANGSSGVGATLTAAAPGVLTVDSTGVPALGSSILVQNQASTFQNGVYTLTTVGTVAVAFVLTRRTDFDQASEMGTPKMIPVNAEGLTAGTANDNKTFLSLTSSPFVVGTTAITFGLLGTTYTADGVTLQLSGTQFSVKSSAALPGSPTTTTQSQGDNSTKIATTAMVASETAVLRNLLPWRVDIDVFMTPAATVGTWTPTVDAAANQDLYAGVLVGGVAQNDSADFVVVLAAGTWLFEAMYTTNNNKGIMTVQLDDGAGSFTTAGTIDTYTAGVVRNVKSQITGIAVGTTVKRTLRILMATKNGSSAAYGASINHMMLRRTA